MHEEINEYKISVRKPEGKLVTSMCKWWVMNLAGGSGHFPVADYSEQVNESSRSVMGRKSLIS
jgi:hypothetical protein